MALHLLKLAVGIDSIAHLAEVQKARRAERRARGERGATWHFTRNFPRRADEVLAGGSFYWVIRGAILARQPVLGFEVLHRPDGRRRCAIRLAARIVRVAPTPHRPIQGWRYLTPGDAPPDLAGRATAGLGGADRLPPDMARELRELGLL